MVCQFTGYSRAAASAYWRSVYLRCASIRLQFYFTSVWATNCSRTRVLSGLAKTTSPTVWKSIWQPKILWGCLVRVHAAALFCLASSLRRMTHSAIATLMTQPAAKLMALVRSFKCSGKSRNNGAAVNTCVLPPAPTA